MIDAATVTIPREYLDSLEKVEERFDTKYEEQARHFHKRLQDFENRLIQNEKSRLQEELSVFNAVGKHINFIENELDKRLREVDAFLATLSQKEARMGPINVYEETKRQLSLDYMSFSKAFVEMQAQRSLLNRLVERLKVDAT